MPSPDTERADRPADVVVVGAGLVGLATALQLARRHPGRRLLVLEKEDRPAAHQSGHNSGVLHMGLYYRPGSHKARLCVAGARALRAFCDRRGVPYRLLGKVVVATRETERAALEELLRRGTANGASGLALFGPERLSELEPHAKGVAALHSPETGIVDFREVARAYATCLAEAGVQVRTGAALVSVARRNGTLHLSTTRGEVATRGLVNCAGLHADRVAALCGHPPDLRIVPFRGEYWTLAPERGQLCRTLIYPVPDPRFPFLGVHFTRRIGGEVEVGPNAVLAFAREGYTRWQVRPGDLAGSLCWPGFWRMAARYWRTGSAEFARSLSRAATVRALQRLVPDVRESDLLPGGAGVRAQAVDRRGALLDDFAIVEAEGAVHVLNAPSPGATSSLAIGAHVASRAAEVLGLGRPATDDLVPA